MDKPITVSIKITEEAYLALTAKSNKTQRALQWLASRAILRCYPRAVKS